MLTSCKDNQQQHNTMFAVQYNNRNLDMNNNRTTTAAAGGQPVTTVIAGNKKKRAHKAKKSKSKLRNNLFGKFKNLKEAYHISVD